MASVPGTAIDEPVGDRRSRTDGPRVLGDLAPLARLKDPTASAVRVRRTVPLPLTRALTAWVTAQPKGIDRFLHANAPVPDDLFAGVALPKPAVDALLSDVRALVAVLLQHASLPYVRVVFEAVRDDKCRKFHADYVHLRFATSYLGPGTEWRPGGAEDGLVVRLKPGDVLAMKGALFVGNDGAPIGADRAAVHRSPPIAGSGQVRVFLSLTASPTFGLV
jgi:hypothetical protein